MNHALPWVCTSVVLLCLPHLAFAGIFISEIQYDLSEGSDSGREWIEIYNDGNEAVNVTATKIIENGKKHGIAEVSGGVLLQPKTYAVVADNAAKFMQDTPHFAGQLFDSAFSLNNSGETLGLLDASGVTVDTITYSSSAANGTGDSWQREAALAVLRAGIPTPGMGIPQGGLIQTPAQPKKSAQKTSKKSSKKSAQNSVQTASVLPSILGEAPHATSTDISEIAIERPQSSGLIWWSLPLLLGTLATTGIVISKQYKKDEWEIIEEIEETS